MQLYQQYSDALNEYSKMPGNPTKEPLFIAILRVKSAAIKLVTNYLLKISSNDVKKISEGLLPLIIPGMIVEYQHSVETSRVPELLELVTVLFQKMKDILSDQIPVFFESIFQNTSSMVTKNFDDYQSFRLPFYKFILEMVQDFIHILVGAPQELFNLLMQTIFWGVQHPQHEICIISLNILNILCSKIYALGGTTWGSFLDTYLLELIMKTFQNMIDTIHKFAFDEQITLLQSLLNEIGNETIVNSIGATLMQIFPNSNPDELAQHLGTMIEMSKMEREAFRQSVRDFLVMTKHYKPMDPALVKEEQKKNDEGYLKFVNAELTEEDFLN